MATTQSERYKRRCGSCGNPVGSAFADAQHDQLDLTEGTVCRECARRIEDHPWTEDLLDEIHDALNPGNHEKWDNLNTEERVLFALRRIQDGTIRGGSPGLVGHLQQYAVLVSIKEEAGGR